MGNIMNPEDATDPRRTFLAQIALVATALQSDVTALSLEAQEQVTRFKADEISLYEATFWLKSLAGAFFAYADGLTYSIRETAASSTDLLGDRLSRNLLRDLDTSKRLPLERAVAVALKSLCHLCVATPVIDTSTEDFRGFKALTEARERFVHPKSHLDVCPFELFPTINPALEWFLHTLRQTFIICGRSLGFPLQTPPQGRRFYFADDKLAPFAARRSEWEAKRETGFVPDLRDVVFPLMDDTSRAMNAMLGRGIKTALQIDCTARNFVRTLFVEIEGSVLIAAALLHSRANAEPPSASLLSGSHEEVRNNVVVLLEKFSSRFGKRHTVLRYGKGWDAFATARALRNRVTHPKSVEDLALQSGDLDSLMELAGWWHGNASECLELNSGRVPL